MKKLILLMFCMVFLIGSVSAAWNWDNVKSYDEDTNTVTIKNSVLKLLPTGTVAKVQLNTPQINRVFPGQDRLVAEFTINNMDNYDNVFNKMEFFDKKRGDKKFQREFIYKYKIIEEYSQAIYGCEGVESPDCRMVYKGSETKYRDVWNDLDDKAILNKGNMTVGIFTDVLPGDNVEWIPTLYGVRVHEWATWTDSMSEGLVLYFNFSADDGGYTNATVGEINGSIAGAVHNTTDCILDNCFTFDGTGDYINLTNDNRVFDHTEQNNFTLSFWIKPIDGGTDYLFRMDDGATEHWNHYISGTGAANKVKIGHNNDNPTFSTSGFPGDQKWQHFVAVYNASGMDVYWNGTLQGHAASGGYIPANTKDLFLGYNGAGTYEGNMDEVGIWNRSLTPTEISDIWNSGAGLGYSGSSVTTNQITPLNEYNETSVLTLDFVCHSNVTGSITLGNSIVKVYDQATNALESADTVDIDGTTNITTHSIALTNNKNYSWFCFVNDSTNTYTDWTTNRSVYVYNSVLGITTTLVYPPNSHETTNSTQRFEGFFTADNGNVTNASVYMWYSNHTLFDNSDVTGLSGITNGTNITLSSIRIHDNYNWNYFTCATNSSGAHSCGYTGSNRTMSRKVFTEDDVHYSNATFETEEEYFEINITTIGTIIDVGGSLIYNGTYYPATITNTTATNYRLARSIDIPLVTNDTGMNFKWKFDVTETTGTSSTNSTEVTQQVNNSLLTPCNATHTTVAVNFTIYNETMGNLTAFTAVNATFKGKLEWYFGTGTVRENSTLDGDYYNWTYPFCTDPTTKIYNTSALIELQHPDFNDRFYAFNKQRYSENTTERKMFMLGTGIGTNVIVQVKDAGLIPLENHFVEIERYYPGTNSYEIVESGETDVHGQITARLIENIVQYRINVRDPNNALIKQTGNMNIACRAAICVLPLVIEDTTDYFDEFYEEDESDWSLTFSETTNTFTLSWTDTSGESATYRLFVDRVAWNGTTNVCNVTSTSSFGSLNCPVGNQNATYQARAHRSASIEKLLGTLSKSVGDVFEQFGERGREGLLWSFFLLMILVSIGYWNPPIGIGLYLVGLIALGSIGLIYLNPAILIAQFVIGVAFIWAFRS